VRTSLQWEGAWLQERIEILAFAIYGREESKEATQKGHGLKIKIVLKTNGRSATKIMLACLSVRDITLAVLFFFSAGRRY
jgi:hypothetical protein